MTVYRLKSFAAVMLVSLLLSACSQGNELSVSSQTQQPYQYTIPTLKNDGWQTGHLADFGIDELTITQLIDDLIQESFPGIDSISIVRNNTLLLHENIRTELSQYDDWVGNRDLDRHVMHSTSKSVISALVGVAIENGFIASTDRPFYSFFNYPEYDNWDYRKELITLDNVLTMQLGLEWDEWRHPFGDPQNSLTNLTEKNDDFVKALLDLPVVTDPGTDYAYNTVASIALGKVIELSTGQPLEEFAEQFLFEPMQIQRADWLMTPAGYPNGGSGLFMPTRDMAKFGQLYLDGGVWNGLQLLSNDWVSRSLQTSVELKWDYTSGYGYQWWLGEFDLQGQAISFYSARGFGGQFVVVVPEYDLVVAFTAHNYDNDLYDSPFRLIEQIILPAIDA